MVHQSVPAPTQQQPWLQKAGTTAIITEDLPEDIEPKWLQNKRLHIYNLNVPYLHHDEIKILLHEQNIDILCLCQTFLNQELCDDESP